MCLVQRFLASKVSGVKGVCCCCVVQKLPGVRAAWCKSCLVQKALSVKGLWFQNCFVKVSDIKGVLYKRFLV